RWAEGSAMFTIVASRTTISWASPTTPRTHQRRAGPAATPDDPARSDTAATVGSLITGAYVRRRRLRKAAYSSFRPTPPRRLPATPFRPGRGTGPSPNAGLRWLWVWLFRGGRLPARRRTAETVNSARRAAMHLRVAWCLPAGARADRVVLPRSQL